MQKADVLIIGAGPAALSALVGLSRNASLRVLQLSGASVPQFGHESWLQAGMKRPQAASLLGLPEVRAFGIGGTTQLWHGGLFVPNAYDEIVSRADRIRTGQDLVPHLRAVLEHSRHQGGPLFKALREVVEHSRHIPDQADLPVRNIYIPRARPKIDAAALHTAAQNLREYGLGADTVVDISAVNGGVQVLCAHGEGFRTIEAGHVVLGAGVLGSGVLMQRLLGIPRLRFADHYHVFSGVVPTKLVARLVRQDVAAPPNLHQVVKFAVELDNGERVDVSFSFRPVSNPDFPRSGRRFGKFVGVNALSRWEKLALIAGNPVTGIEMLAYRWGIQLPLASSLVHATVSPVGRVGTIDEAGIDPAIPRTTINAAIRQAWSRLCERAGPQAVDMRLFPEEQITDSIISGAQFVGSLADGLPSEHLLSGLVTIADCSRFQFTSVYNQGLVSLAAGYAAVAGKFQ